MINAASAARWQAPDLAPEAEHRAATQTLTVLRKIRTVMHESLNSGEPLHWIVDLGTLEPATKAFLCATLATGEVLISLHGGQATIEETQVPSVWRMKLGEQESLIVALLPRYLLGLLDAGQTAIVEPEHKPEGLFAARAILAELSQALEKADLSHVDSEPARQIELSRQPLTPADLNYILATLGRGQIQIQLQGFARSRMYSTKVRGVWRNEILNNAGKSLLDSLVVALIPPEIPAFRPELPDYIQKVDDLIEWIDRDLQRGVLG